MHLNTIGVWRYVAWQRFYMFNLLPLYSLFFLLQTGMEKCQIKNIIHLPLCLSLCLSLTPSPPPFLFWPVLSHFSAVTLRARQLLQCFGGEQKGPPQILIYQWMTRHHQWSKWMVLTAAGPFADKACPRYKEKLRLLDAGCCLGAAHPPARAAAAAVITAGAHIRQEICSNSHSLLSYRSELR